MRNLDITLTTELEIFVKPVEKDPKRLANLNLILIFLKIQRNFLTLPIIFLLLRANFMRIRRDQEKNTDMPLYLLFSLLLGNLPQITIYPKLSVVLMMLTLKLRMKVILTHQILSLRKGQAAKTQTLRFLTNLNPPKGVLGLILEC